MNVGSRFLRGMSDSRRRSSASRGPMWSPSPSTVRMTVTAIVILALLAFIYLTSTFWVQWWWFESVGYQTALTTRYMSSAIAFIVAGLLGGGFSAFNWWLALRRTGSAGRGSRIAASPVLRVPLVGLSLAVGVFVGLLAADRWDTLRLAFAGNSFGVTDAIYGLDARFYVFLLPALNLAHRIAIGVTLVTLVAVALLYLGQRGSIGSINCRRHRRRAVTCLGWPRSHWSSLAPGISLPTTISNIRRGETSTGPASPTLR